MKQMIVALLTLVIFANLSHFVRAEEGELIPKSVWTDHETAVSKEIHFSADKMIDGDMKTFASFFDHTRTGSDPKAVPVNGNFPITTEFVLDLGKESEIVGIRFVSRNAWITTSVKNVSIYSCDDPKGKTNVKPIRENEELLPTNSSFSAYVLWKPVSVRYLLVKVNDAYQNRNRRVDWPILRIFQAQIAEIRCLTIPPKDPCKKNPPDVAYPLARLHNDWMMQDHGPDVSQCFRLKKDAELECTMVDKVLAEIAQSSDTSTLKQIKENLIKEKCPGSDPRWKDLYLKACDKRRFHRLAFLREETDRIVYTKHYVFGGTEGLTGMPQGSDEQHIDLTSERRHGSQLCMITLKEDGSLKHEVLIEKPEGVIRDPSLSFDAKKLLFSMRDNFTKDDYHIFEMDLADRSVRKITSNPVVNGKEYPCVDMEPCFTPSGDILFSSTRHVQINDCWPNANTNIYTCKPDGSAVRRLGYDELDVNFPQILHDGRVVFTRWEYSDRNAFFLHPICTMNPDGTTQTEYCGNNSMFPSSYIQVRPIPDSTKLIATISGHHVLHKGKLALIDRTQGTQDGKNIEFVAGSSPDGTPGRQRSTIKTTGVHNPAIDFFGQKGPQYQYPFALDEDHYLLAYCPEGWLYDYGPFCPPFGIYFMTATGERELLAFDWWISSGQPTPIIEREVPPIRPSSIDHTKNTGVFDIQDIYIGPGLKGIPRGTVKKLRVVALEYRAGKMGKGSNAGEVSSGLVQTPISFNNGSWDVKHVLGEVDVEEDGSVAFEVPARTPVYFQLLDEKGYCVQTMRSWATLQGGEHFSCLGCHEDKLDTQMMTQGRSASIAMQRAPQKLQPIGSKKHPLMERLEKENCLDSIEGWLGVNAPAVNADPYAPVAGFSYRQEIQPILDKHCIECHQGDTKNSDPKKRSSLDLRGTMISVDHLKVNWDDDYKRLFSQSYLNLTNQGRNKGGKWIQFLEVRSRSDILPPYHTGSSKSSLMKYLEPAHYGVQVSESEKRTIACWIDILIPYCGSYVEANTWTDEERKEYLYYVKKRRDIADQERLMIRESLKKK